MKNKITKGVIAIVGTSMLLTGCGTLNKENQAKLDNSVKQTTEMRNQLEKYSRELADSKIDNEEFKHKMKQEFDKYIDEQSAELDKKAEKTKKMTEILRNKLDEALMEMDELDQDEIEKEPGEPLPETIPYLPESGYPEEDAETEDNQNKEEYILKDGELIPRNKNMEDEIDAYFKKMEQTPRLLEDEIDETEDRIERFLKSPEDLEEHKEKRDILGFTNRNDLSELKVTFNNPFTNKEVTNEDMQIRGNKLTYKYNVMQIGKDLNQEGKFLQVDVRLKQSNLKEDKHETSTTYNGKESRTTIKKSFGVKGKDGKEYIVDLVFNGVKGRLEAEKSVEELVESIEINS
jgi:hypothetical protein